MVADRGAGEALRQQQRKSGRRRLAPTSRRRAQNNRAHHARSTDNPLASRSAQVFELKKIKATVMSVGSQILLLGGPGWGRGGTFFSGHTLHTNVHTSGTHLATRPLSSSARAGRGAAAGRHSVESHSTASARRWNDASGTGGRETKAPSAKRKLCARNNESDRQRAAPQLTQHPPSGIIANCIACAHRTTTAKNRSVNVHTLPARVQIARARVRSDTPPYPYDDRFNTFGCDLCLFTVRGGAHAEPERVTLSALAERR